MNWRLTARMAVGPLALLGFFLPWGTGPGPFASVYFTGYRLVAFTGSLNVLVDGIIPTTMLLIVRLSILAVAVAAVWNGVLAAAFRWHPMYKASGWYLTATGLGLAAVAAAAGQGTHPATGTAALAAAAVLFLLAELTPVTHPASRHGDAVSSTGSVAG